MKKKFEEFSNFWEKYEEKIENFKLIPRTKNSGVHSNTRTILWRLFLLVIQTTLINVCVLCKLITQLTKKSYMKSKAQSVEDFFRNPGFFKICFLKNTFRCSSSKYPWKRFWQKPFINSRKSHLNKFWKESVEECSDENLQESLKNFQRKIRDSWINSWRKL